MILKRSYATIVLALSVVAASQAATFATFDDPSKGKTPLFDVNVSNDTFHGGWSGKGLELEIPFLHRDYKDATFETSVINFTPVGSNVAITGAGEIDFFTKNNNPIFSILFDGGLLTAIGFGANQFIGDDVTFVGPNVPKNITNEQFSFAFANLTSTRQRVTATAAFTSSADVVPEPMSMSILGMSLVGFVARRRRKN